MRKIICLSLISLLLTSCFKAEPENTECDIIDAWIEGEGLEAYFFNEADMRFSDIPSGVQNIVFTVRSVASLPPMALHFNMTPGATVNPANGSIQDFSKGPVVYTVTSEDGNWQRQYTVSFNSPVPPPATEHQIRFDFEHFKIDETYNRFYMWYELNADDTQNEKIWASGNAGFIIAKAAEEAEAVTVSPA